MNRKLPVCLALWLLLSAAAAPAQTTPAARPDAISERLEQSGGAVHLDPAPSSEEAELRAELEARATQKRKIDRIGTAIRLAVLAAAAFVLILGRRARRRGTRLTPRTRRVVLGGLAALAFAANFNFFAFPHASGFHIHEVYHYYLGAKYFPELGYTRLYECSVAAVKQTHRLVQLRAFKVRDLRTHKHRLAAAVMPRGPRCNGAFSPDRWMRFRTDVEWFGSTMGWPSMVTVLMDYGYNPSPVWTLVGRPIASVVPAHQVPLVLLSRLDLVLMATAFGFLAWGFGFEGMCLAVIAWGANPLSRYAWIGDAFLRYGWLASSLIGIACLKRGRPLAAGALLAGSSLLRLFPACFAFVYGLWGTTRGQPARAELLRFAKGAGIATVILLLAAIVVNGRGIGVATEFASNMRAYSSEAYWNSVGLRPLLSFTTRDPDPVEQRGQRLITEDARKELRHELFRQRRPVYLAALALLLVLLWRATRACAGWEAAALGFPLIVALSSPPTYYLSCVVVVALLAIDRPRLQLALLLSLAGWCIANLRFYHSQAEFGIASAIAVALATFTLVEVRRQPVSAEGGTRSAIGDPTASGEG